MPPIFSPAPFIFTMHDLIHVHAAGSARGLYYNAVIRPLARRAFRIATVSNYSREEICAWAGLSQERVVVIPNGVADSFSVDGDIFNPGYPYLLYVGAQKRHKNLESLLRAFARSGLRGSCRILFSGSPNDSLRSLAAKLDIEDDVRFAGFIDEDRLPSYYRGAQAVVMVSTYEGFGLPVLEGMASGVPVLCSNTTSLRELGSGAALLVDPMAIDEIALGLERIIEDGELRSHLIAKGLIRAQQFNWDRSAGLLEAELKSAAMAFQTGL